MEVEFVKRELNLLALSGEELDDSVQELISKFKRPLSYKVIEPFIETWYNHLDEKVLIINNMENCVTVYLTNMDLHMGFNSDVCIILIQHILGKNLSTKDFRFVVNIDMETILDIK